MERGLLDAVDAWIAEQAERIPPRIMKRPEAVRQLAAEALQAMGLLKL